MMATEMKKLLMATALIVAVIAPAKAKMYIGVPGDTFVAPKWRDVPDLPSASKSSEYVTGHGFASRTFKGRRDFSRYINQGWTRNSLGSNGESHQLHIVNYVSKDTMACGDAVSLAMNGKIDLHQIKILCPGTGFITKPIFAY